MQHDKITRFRNLEYKIPFNNANTSVIKSFFKNMTDDKLAAEILRLYKGHASKISDLELDVAVSDFSNFEERLVNQICINLKSENKFIVISNDLVSKAKEISGIINNTKENMGNSLLYDIAVSGGDLFYRERDNGDYMPLTEGEEILSGDCIHVQTILGVSIHSQDEEILKRLDPLIRGYYNVDNNLLDVLNESKYMFKASWHEVNVATGETVVKPESLDLWLYQLIIEKLFENIDFDIATNAGLEEDGHPKLEEVANFVPNENDFDLNPKRRESRVFRLKNSDGATVIEDNLQDYANLRKTPYDVSAFSLYKETPHHIKTKHRLQFILKRSPSWTYEETSTKYSILQDDLLQSISQTLKLSVLSAYDSARSGKAPRAAFKIIIQEITELLLDSDGISKVFDDVTEGIRWDFARYREITRTVALLDQSIKKRFGSKIKKKHEGVEDIFRYFLLLEFSNYINFSGAFNYRKAYIHKSSRIDSWEDVQQLIQCERFIKIFEAYARVISDVKTQTNFNEKRRMSRSNIDEVFEAHAIMLSSKINEIAAAGDLFKIALLGIATKEFSIYNPLFEKAPELFESEALRNLSEIGQLLFPAITNPEILGEAMIWNDEAIHVREKIEKINSLILNSEIMKLSPISEIRNKYTMCNAIDSSGVITGFCCLENRKLDTRNEVFSTFEIKKGLNDYTAFSVKPYENSSKIIGDVLKSYEKLGNSEWTTSLIKDFLRLTDGLNILITPTKMNIPVFGTRGIRESDILAISLNEGFFTLAHYGSVSTIVKFNQDLFAEYTAAESKSLIDDAAKLSSARKYMAESRKDLLSVTGEPSKILYKTTITGLQAVFLPEIRPLLDYIEVNDPWIYICTNFLGKFQEEYNGQESKIIRTIAPEELKEIAYYDMANTPVLGPSIDVILEKKKMDLLGTPSTLSFDMRDLVRINPLEFARIYDQWTIRGEIRNNICLIKEFLNFFKANALSDLQQKQFNLVLEDKLAKVVLKMANELLTPDVKMFILKQTAVALKKYTALMKVRVIALKSHMKLRLLNEITLQTLYFIGIVLDTIDMSDLDFLIKYIRSNYEFKLNEDIFHFGSNF